jgi:SET domain-containing protein
LHPGAGCGIVRALFLQDDIECWSIAMNASVRNTELVEFSHSPIHGCGGFARRFIPVDTSVIEYVGERISKSESLVRCEQSNAYIFALDDAWDLDGSVDWNPARWLNHSCEPNCEAQEGEGRIWIVALRDIEAGEELTFNYNYDLEEYREHPCRCAAPGCVGYMVAEEYFRVVRRNRAVGV